ncbi:hypothetical protein [Singulisphaera acidiphila]|uniref:Uncharacterized protein n=1 Tax=Singulisphaera acidiphila (strain ATCC BAA-1392 / DSM 18658 / VKM B-2454 / MOB10) TaxID=886293 RepID=L0D697_SINAD|nr:hypothetical protein [Singulisphaera acidiphila]AGA24787.1 hypothetical protein Sinac_0345 [Singulisphaera acidiphila DSM 18658]
MTINKFIERIESSKINNLAYKVDGKEGLVSVWKYDGSYFVTWEECPAGEQYDESTYTRDERHRLGSIEQLMAFLADQGLRPEAFQP